VKRPFWERSVNETLDIVVYVVVLTLFSRTNVTVAVWPTVSDVGNWFPGFPSSMSRY
jgi:hypothetical protein